MLQIFLHDEVLRWPNTDLNMYICRKICIIICWTNTCLKLVQTKPSLELLLVLPQKGGNICQAYVSQGVPETCCETDAQ